MAVVRYSCFDSKVLYTKFLKLIGKIIVVFLLKFWSLKMWVWRVISVACCSIYSTKNSYFQKIFGFIRAKLWVWGCVPYQAFIVGHDTSKNRVHHFSLYTAKRKISWWYKIPANSCAPYHFEKIYLPVCSNSSKIMNLSWKLVLHYSAKKIYHKFFKWCNIGDFVEILIVENLGLKSDFGCVLFDLFN